MNIEKYNKIHDELMNRLENGEITVETVKEVHDLAFEKYITETPSPIVFALAPILPWLFLGGIFTIGAIMYKIETKKEFKNKEKELHSISEYKKIIYKFTQDLDKVQEIKYHPSAIDVIKRNQKLINENEQKLEKLDKKLFKCKTVDEFNTIKNELENQYRDLYSQIENSLSQNNKKLKKESEYVSGREILPVLTEYLDTIYQYRDYSRTIDGDDFWEAIDFLRSLPDDGNQKIFDDAYKCMTTFKNRSVSDMKGFVEVLNYIKVRFK